MAYVYNEACYLARELNVFSSDGSLLCYSAVTSSCTAQKRAKTKRHTLPSNCVWVSSDACKLCIISLEFLSFHQRRGFDNNENKTTTKLYFNPEEEEFIMLYKSKNDIGVLVIRNNLRSSYKMPGSQLKENIFYMFRSWTYDKQA